MENEIKELGVTTESPRPAQVRGLGLIANKKFKIGQRVRLTEAALAQGLARTYRKNRATTGVVTGFCGSPYSVRIRRDGRKTPEPWSIDFWEIDRRRKARNEPEREAETTTK